MKLTGAVLILARLFNMLFIVSHLPSFIGNIREFSSNTPEAVGSLLFWIIDLAITWFLWKYGIKLIKVKKQEVS